MKAVILAAGDGTRLCRDKPKPLVAVGGIPLLERNISTLLTMGIDEVVVVIGYQAEVLREFLRQSEVIQRCRLTIVENEEWEKENAISVWKAKDFVDEWFLVVMADHLFDERAVRGLTEYRHDFVAVIDSQPRCVDIDEATKVLVKDGQVKRIGKHLTAFNALDAGMFLCSRRIFPTVKRCIKDGRDSWNDVKREWIATNVMGVYDLEGAFWYDVDTEDDLKKAERLLLRQLVKPRDGMIAKHLNRRLSTWFSQYLVKTTLTPNQISFTAFLLSGLAAFCFALGHYAFIALGGLLAQLASVLDGCDGEVARLKQVTSNYGAWFDAVLDRWADALIIFGMTYGSWATQGAPLIWAIGFLALVGSFGVSYSESRYESAFRQKLEHGGFHWPVKRDSRLFLVMLGGLLQQIPLTLLIIGGLGLSEVIRRLLVNYPRVKKEA